MMVLREASTVEECLDCPGTPQGEREEGYIVPMFILQEQGYPTEK
jgi:hypothetical protein